ncbi:hypothetical protein CEXT_721171 [Caerostris extrusa]|uniref:Transposase n=1 Tax=Caerostris extrusa TaxID=172846 RepID=A0AAV4V9J0_CAEEX|nr:hypothetical protein CEXT_721171 [Caerostris extrusa]
MQSSTHKGDGDGNPKSARCHLAEYYDDPGHVQKRKLNWSKFYSNQENVSWTRQRWASVLFTDESRITLERFETSADLREQHQIPSIQHC